MNTQISHFLSGANVNVTNHVMDRLHNVCHRFGANLNVLDYGGSGYGR